MPSNHFTPEQVAQIKIIVGEAIDEKMNTIAEAASDLSQERFFASVGHATINKAAYILGVGIVALFGWLVANGFIKP
jgi:hypothetical protein